MHHSVSWNVPLVAPLRRPRAYAGPLALLMLVVVPPRAEAGSEAARVVKGVAWEMVSPQVRTVIGALLGSALGAPQASTGTGPSAECRALFVDGGGPEEEGAGSRAERVARLDERRSTMLDARHARTVRGEALQELAALSLELYSADCCRHGAPEPWSRALAELEGTESAVAIERLVGQHPALRGLESAIFPEPAESAESHVSACGAGREGEDCSAEDFVLAGFRLALLLEEALSSCRTDPEGEVVCLPYTGRATDSCLRALPLTWGSGAG